MKTCKFVRNANIIQHNDTGAVFQTFPSINKAKHESRKLQIRENGALGLGVLHSLT